jgi:hypothetical protein
MTMAKRTSRSKESPAQNDDSAVRKAPAETTSNRSALRPASPNPGAAVMDRPGQLAAPAADDSTRADSMASEPPAMSPSRPIGDDDIRARAYQRYLERGGTHGQDMDDWIEAEQELRNRK